ncbi:MAG TPA: outer membrane lipoprotein chaperone LolA [Gemmatimonadales bacterium]|nr:outer membrane lipoprotein chaperone LolA [Gemmatimonadales bacterium]
MKGREPGAASRLIPLLLALLPGGLAAQDPFAALGRAKAAYDSLHTIRCDFIQIIDNPMLGAPDTTRGILYQEPPARFAMNFTRPKGDRIVSDGTYLWIYTPSSVTGQVIRAAIPARGTTGPNLITQFVERPREQYRARFVRTDSSAAGPVDVVHLEPIAPDPPYTEATVSVGASGLVLRLDIVERSGQRRVLIFSKHRLNEPVAASTFRFTPGAGVRVVDQ